MKSCIIIGYSALLSCCSVGVYHLFTEELVLEML